MKKYIRLLLCFVFGLIAFGSFGQNKGSEKYKPPKLFTSLGSVNHSDTLLVKDVVALVPLSLTITDGSKRKYEISSYQLAYTRAAFTEDEITGKTMPTTTMVSSLFRSTPLPEIWISQVTQDLKPGEELYFFDVFVKDEKGRILAAPNLRINTK